MSETRTAGPRKARDETGGAADAAPPAAARVTFLPSGLTVEAGRGASLLDVAAKAGVEIDAPCGGQGRCGRCKVRIEGDGVESRPSVHLGAEEAAQGFALACLAVVEGDVVVTVPPKKEQRHRPRGHAVAEPEALPFTCDWRQDPAVRMVDLDIEPPSLADNTSDFDRLQRALLQQHGIKAVRAELPMLRRLGRDLRMANWKVKVALEMRDWVYGTYLPPRLIRVYPSVFGQRSMGVAVDLGTTSVVAYLDRLRDGARGRHRERLQQADRLRRRRHLAHRVRAPRGRPRAPAAPRRRDHQRAPHRAAGAEPDRGLRDPRGHARRQHDHDPPAARHRPALSARGAVHPDDVDAARADRRRARADANPLARVHALPCVGSYVGGDITAGVISSGLYATDKLTVFIDIGTNGEMVLGNKDWLVACACSAGPAFEGGGVACGMRATAGAIEDVWIDSHTLEAIYRTVDDAPPRGICGSGLIDLVAELFVTGRHRQGRAHPPAALATPRVRDGLGGAEYVVAWGDETDDGRDIAVGESDISSLVRAKAAVYAGIARPLPLGGRRARRRRAVPHRRRLRRVHRRREGDPHRPASRPAPRALQLSRQHQRHGRLHRAALRERAPRRARRGRRR